MKLNITILLEILLFLLSLAVFLVCLCYVLSFPVDPIPVAALVLATGCLFCLLMKMLFKEDSGNEK
jgi:hypothetical protein